MCREKTAQEGNSGSGKAAPTTIAGIIQWMEENGYSFNGYLFGRGCSHEGYGIDRDGPNYAWYYSERGKKQILEVYSSEQELAAYIFPLISADTWGRAHLLGKSENEGAIHELCRKLEGMGIHYERNDMPPYRPGGKTVFRVFVFGNDFNQASYLKAEYYE